MTLDASGSTPGYESEGIAAYTFYLRNITTSQTDILGTVGSPVFSFTVNGYETGSYEFGLKVRNLEGVESSETLWKPVEIINASPISAFSYEVIKTGVGGLLIYNVTENNSYDPDGTIVIYQWFVNDQEDLSVRNQLTPSFHHSPQNPINSWKLVVTDNLGATGTSGF